jgi:spermidine/putrescine-binding protein
VLQGGEVLQETIAANVTEEWVSLEFQRSDGTLVTQILDFKNVSIHYIYTTTCIIYRSRGVKSQKSADDLFPLGYSNQYRFKLGRGKIIYIEHDHTQLLTFDDETIG